MSHSSGWLQSIFSGVNYLLPGICGLLVFFCGKFSVTVSVRQSECMVRSSCTLVAVIVQRQFDFVWNPRWWTLLWSRKRLRRKKDSRGTNSSSTCKLSRWNVSQFRVSILFLRLLVVGFLWSNQDQVAVLKLGLLVVKKIWVQSFWPIRKLTSRANWCSYWVNMSLRGNYL